MNSFTDFDDLKSSWQQLARRLELQNNLLLKDLHKQRLDLLKRLLRPLRWGQSVQMLFGVAMILLAVSVWSRHPADEPLFIAGVVMHVYGVAMIMVGGITLGLLGKIQYGAPVLTIQKQLARLRKTYVITSMWLGIVWWVLWIPFMMMIFDTLFSADMYSNLGPAISWMIATGLVGLILTALVHRWAIRRPVLGRHMEASAAGNSLNRAQAALDEISEFEHS